MWLEALFLTSVGFWGFFALVFLGLIFCVEYERPSLATVFLAIVIAVLQVFSPYKVASWIIDEPFKFFLFIIGYIGIGIVWSCLRWVFYVKSTKRRYTFAYNAYQALPESTKKNESKITYSNRIQSLMKPDNWRSYDYGLDDETFRPLIRKNKSRFMLWLAYWPWSMLWTVINDPIRRAFDYIYYSLAGHLQAYSDKIFGDVHAFEPKSTLKRMDEDEPASATNATDASGRRIRVGLPPIDHD